MVQKKRGTHGGPDLGPEVLVWIRWKVGLVVFRARHEEAVGRATFQLDGAQRVGVMACPSKDGCTSRFVCLCVCV